MSLSAWGFIVLLVSLFKHRPPNPQLQAALQQLLKKQCIFLLCFKLIGFHCTLYSVFLYKSMLAWQTSTLIPINMQSPDILFPICEEIYKQVQIWQQQFSTLLQGGSYFCWPVHSSALHGDRYTVTLLPTPHVCIYRLCLMSSGTELSAVVFGQHVHPILILVIFFLGLFDGQTL
jgi:hypothetical protein